MLHSFGATISDRRRWMKRFGPLASLASWQLVTLFVLMGLQPIALAGGLVRAPAVGGVYVDAEGVVSSPAEDDSENLQAVWQSGLDPVPADLQNYTERRFVSLRNLDKQLAEAKESGEPLADSVRYLAGMLRVEYVLAYPPTEAQPEGDIVLAGPAEGWKVDRLGNTVGITTGRPVLMLEDLIVALRAAESSNGPGISCSIDPTQEGLARAQKVQKNMPAGVSPLAASKRLEQALGRQVISVSGVPATSHFARTLVAADFRMKRLAMGFEPSPVAGLPSYLDVVNTRRISGNLLPRWWLTANYKPLARDKEGLAWQIRGQGVKCMAEQDLVDASGNLKRNQGAANDARQWADQMTEAFEDLANHDSAFGHLRNALDLSVVAALLTKEDLWSVAKVATPELTEGHELERYAAPQSVATRATMLKKGNKWVITASGGVQFFPWQVADRSEESIETSQVRSQALETMSPTAWWWQ